MSDLKKTTTGKHHIFNDRIEIRDCLFHGVSFKRIAMQIGKDPMTVYVTTLIQTYKRQGLEEYIRIKQTSHRRNMSEEEEAKVLAQCEEEAEAGKVLTAETVRRKLEEQLGRETSTNYVYRVMERNGWRKETRIWCDIILPDGS